MERVSITRQWIGLMLAGLMCAGIHVAAAQAATVYETEYSSEQPLMVIRFNQRYVMYQQPLYNTLSQALQVKPTALFDVVSVIPRASDPHDQPRFNQMAQQNTQKVLATLNEMGLPQSRITLTSATDNVEASEVRIFVH